MWPMDLHVIEQDSKGNFKSNLLSRKIIVNSVLACLLVLQPTVCSIIDVFVNVNYLSLFLMAFIIFLSLYINGFKIKIKRECVLIYFVLLALLGVSCFFNYCDALVKYIEFYFVFGMTALLVAVHDINLDVFVKTAIIVYFIRITTYFLFSRNTLLFSVSYYSEQLGVAYSLLPCVFICFVLLLYKNTQIHLIYKIISILLLIATIYIFLFDTRTRGVFVWIPIGLIFIISTCSKKNKKLLIYISVLVLAILIISFWDSIWEYIANRFSNSNIRVINKMIRTMGSGDVTNGRATIYEDAIAIIKESPIFGSLVGYFEKKTGEIYTHNLFLQIGCEFGLFGIVLFVVFIIKYGISFVFGETSNEKVFMCFLFVSSILITMVSSSYWLLPQFWFYVFYIISNHRKERGNMA